MREVVFVLLVSALIPGRVEARQDPGEVGAGAQAGDGEVFQPSGFARTPFVEVRGQVFVDQPRQLTDPIEIRLTEESGVIRDYAGAFGSGHFVFRDVPSIGVFYIDIDVEGFDPVHFRLDGADLAVGPFLTFILKTSERWVEVEVEGDEDEADGLQVVDLTELQTEIPEEAREEYEQSLIAAEAGDHGRAVEHLEAALELQPNYFEARNNLGVQYLMLGRSADAEATLQQARELNPNSSRPLLNLGTLYIQQGDGFSQAGEEDAAEGSYGEAVAVLDDAIIKDPLSPRTSYYLGVALYKAGEYDASEAVLYRALDLDPEMHEARLVLVNVYTRLGFLDEALDQAATFLAADPDSPDRGALEEITGQIEAALGN